MTLDAMTRAESEKLPVFETCPEHEVGAFYLWSAFTDEEHTFFVRPSAVAESECLADVFGIRDGIVKPLGRELFVRESGTLRLLED
ncbi:hypothetical protein ACGF5O_14005 [Streptomyces sp. NPDC048291]|uniref:hypothetical protein n=1 Tax=Streptomyces sp. NPDC048291 TaxID=3365530 RepID=UPI003717ECFB